MDRVLPRSRYMALTTPNKLIRGWVANEEVDCQSSKALGSAPFALFIGEFASRILEGGLWPLLFFSDATLNRYR